MIMNNLSTQKYQTQTGGIVNTGPISVEFLFFLYLHLMHSEKKRERGCTFKNELFMHHSFEST